MPDRVDKAAGPLQFAEPLDLDRRVADDPQQLLVRPHIGFERRDIQIADRNHPLPAVRPCALGSEPRRQLVKKLQLVREFRIFAGVGNIAAGRHIDVVEFDAARQLDDGVAAILAGAPRAGRRGHEGFAGQDRDAVIALHPVHQHVPVARCLERLARKQLVRRLRLLQAQDIGSRLVEQTADKVDAQPHRVDVPGDQTHG